MNHLLLTALILLAGCGSDEHSHAALDGWVDGGLFQTFAAQGDKNSWACKQAPCGVFILHQGHDCFDDCTPTDGHDSGMARHARELAKAGFVVYGFQMPPVPHVGPDVEVFYRPVLDFIKTVPSGTPIFMAGLSGGGWTTTVSTALEKRIARGYSVSGDVPGYPSKARCAEIDPHEFEQCNPPKPLVELYAMAGERLLHIYNDEGGVFGGVSGPMGYPYLTDPSEKTHRISEATIAFIIKDIRAFLLGQKTASQLSASGQSIGGY